MNLKTVTLTIDENQNASLLTHLRVAGHVIPAYCAGKGVCGKCKVRFIENAPAWKENEARFFTEEEYLEKKKDYILESLNKFEQYDFTLCQAIFCSILTKKIISI